MTELNRYTGTINKPVVMYYPAVAGQADPVIGNSRYAVIPINHPNTILNDYVAYTTEVVAVDANGKGFETKNTIYVLAD